jgi:hypothetical protein
MLCRKLQNRRGGGRGSSFIKPKDFDAELDFDEVMSDDENVDLGIENEEEQKEAIKRAFGNEKSHKIRFDEGEDEEGEEGDARKRKGGTAGKVMIFLFYIRFLYVY